MRSGVLAISEDQGERNGPMNYSAVYPVLPWLITAWDARSERATTEGVDRRR